MPSALTTTQPVAERSHPVNLLFRAVGYPLHTRRNFLNGRGYLLRGGRLVLRIGRENR